MQTGIIDAHGAPVTLTPQEIEQGLRLLGILKLIELQNQEAKIEIGHHDDGEWYMYAEDNTGFSTMSGEATAANWTVALQRLEESWS